VIDVDIKGFFDNLNHEIMMQLLQKHTHEKWVIMYAERWLKAGVEQEDGSIIARTEGIPQGGVISPLLANIYLHHAFDKWKNEEHRQNPYERYADDIVIHCISKEEAEQLLAKLRDRMQEYELTLHPEKTKIVYCKNYQRKETNKHESFTFLGYDFQPRRKRDGYGRSKTYIIFAAAISNKAKTSIKEVIRSILVPRWSEQTLEKFGHILNPKLRGWINYYGKYYRRLVLELFIYLNQRIKKWIANKYKLRTKKRILAKYQLIQSEQPYLFYHWHLGIKA
jgi:RNA-directed DNA polymerase